MSSETIQPGLFDAGQSGDVFVPQLTIDPTAAGELPIVLNFGNLLTRMTDDDFFKFCQVNDSWRIERTAQGDIIIMGPTVFEGGRQNASLIIELGIWSKRDGTGIVLDSNTGFTLPNNAVRSPDAAWVLRSRAESLPQNEREQFSRLVPDFVVELRSKSDRPPVLREKMIEYMSVGVRLGWLIDPLTRQVEVYRPNQPVVVLDNPATISGDPELPGFTLDLAAIW